ncbi:unnamed protein product, partial [marine sediment metagenome]
NYYVISIYPNSVKLQGWNNQNLKKRIEEFMPDPTIKISKGCEYIDYKRGILEITLTKNQ